MPDVKLAIIMNQAEPLAIFARSKGATKTAIVMKRTSNNAFQGVRFSISPVSSSFFSIRIEE